MEKKAFGFVLQPIGRSDPKAVELYKALCGYINSKTITLEDGDIHPMYTLSNCHGTGTDCTCDKDD